MRGVSNASDFGRRSSGAIPAILDYQQQLAARGKSNLRTYLDTHWNNLRTYLKNGKVARAHWLQSCKTL